MIDEYINEKQRQDLTNIFGGP